MEAGTHRTSHSGDIPTFDAIPAGRNGAYAARTSFPALTQLAMGSNCGRPLIGLFETESYFVSVLELKVEALPLFVLDLFDRV